MVGRKEMDGKRLQREMTERRRDEMWRKKQNKCTSKQKSCEKNTRSNFKVRIQPFYFRKSAAH